MTWIKAVITIIPMTPASILLVLMPGTGMERAFCQIRTIECLISDTLIIPIWIDGGGIRGTRDLPAGGDPESVLALLTPDQDDKPVTEDLEEKIESCMSMHSPAMTLFFVSRFTKEHHIQRIAAFVRGKAPDMKTIVFDWDSWSDGWDELENRILKYEKNGIDRLREEIADLYGISKSSETKGISPVMVEGGQVYKEFGYFFLVSPWTFDSPEALAGYMDAHLDTSRVTYVAFLLGGDERPSAGALVDRLALWLERKPTEMTFSIQLQANQDAGKLLDGPHLSHLYDHGLRMIMWQRAENGLDRKLLWQTARQGVWNHVAGNDLFNESEQPEPEAHPGQGAWIANNPNIVHSFESRGKTLHGPGDDKLLPQTVRIPRALLQYGRVTPVPGVSLWQVLPDPLQLLSLLTAASPKVLARHRVDPGGRIHVLGTGITYFFKPPRELARETMDEIVAMVDAGGSVDITHVRANLEHAYLIGYAVENGVIVGNSSLKHPRPVFIERLRGITGLDFTDFVERGYTSVRPEYRALGIGTRLLEGLTARAGDKKVFSIIGEDNLATQKIAIRNKTRKIAVYFSDKTGKDMGVWMPAHMVDDNWDLGI